MHDELYELGFEDFLVAVVFERAAIVDGTARARDRNLFGDHERAQAQGVTSELHLKAKMPHVWPTMLMLPEARQTLKECGAFATRVTGQR